MHRTNTRSAEPRGARALVRRLARGQAMIEYSVVSHFLLFSGTVLLLPLIVKLINALNTFYHGMYMTICNGGV